MSEFSIPDLDELLSDILTAYKNQIDGANTNKRSDIYVKAAALRGVVWGLYYYQRWIKRQIFPDTAALENLLHHCQIRNIIRKSATGSEGQVLVRGSEGSTFPAEMEMTFDGLRFKTSEGGVIPAELWVIVDGESIDTGEAVNILDGSIFTITSPPEGIDQAEAYEDFEGGTEQETPEELLERYLDDIREPPAGGNAHDYEKWALEVPGVDKAKSHPLRRGLGTIDVSLLAEGNTAPTQDVIDDVQDHIDGKRPVTAKDFMTLAPDFVEQDVEVVVTPAAGYEFSDIGANKTCQAGCTQTTIVVDSTEDMSVGDYVVIAEEQRIVDEVTDGTHFTVTEEFSFIPDEGDLVRPGGSLWQPVYDSIDDYFDELVPGGTLYLSKLEAKISNVSGVEDREILEPTENVEADADDVTVELIKKGSVIITPAS